MIMSKDAKRRVETVHLAIESQDADRLIEEGVIDPDEIICDDEDGMVKIEIQLDGRQRGPLAATRAKR
jgi:hypothetical protein